MQLKCKELKSRDELEEVMSELREFINMMPNVPLCCTADWLSGWLSNYWEKRDKLIIQLHYANDRLVAFYPLYLKKIAFGHELRFLGTGEPEIAEICSEFQDFIITKEYEQASLNLFTLFMRSLKTLKKITFENIVETAHCYQWLCHYPLQNWQYRTKYVGERFLLKIAPNNKEQIQLLEQSTLRRYARRFEENKDIHTDYCTNPDDIESFFSDLIFLHQKQWQQKGKTGAFSTNEFRSFHQEFASQLLKENKLLLFRIHYLGQPIAVFYGFHHSTYLYYYQSGIGDASGIHNIGVGMHLIAMTWARNQGIFWYDLMRGHPKGYKCSYTNHKHPVFTTEAASAGLAKLYAFKSGLKRICHKVRL